MHKPRLLAAVLAASLVSGLSAQTTCLSTLFAANNGGSTGGAVYFDITVNKAVRVASLEMNFSAAATTVVGVNVYITPKTSIGKETNKALWKQVAKDNGKAKAAGRNGKTKITLAAPFILTPGSYGVALESVGSGHAYTNGTATNTKYQDSTVSLALGKATNVPFTGTPFTPRVWNGTICYTLGKGLYSEFAADKTSGPSPLTVQFTDKTFTSSAGGVKGWAWDLNGDNKIDSTVQNPKWTYPKTTWDAKYSVTLTTTDGVFPASKLTKTAYITVDPSNASAVDFGKGSTTKPIRTPIGQPANTTHYSSATGVRGFYFVAPTTLIINGFEAPNTYTPKQTNQTVTCYVLAKAPAGAFIAKAADIKFHGTGKANTVLKPTKPVVVLKGQWVGILGACHGAAVTSPFRNSYGNGSYKTSVLGQPITLNRLWMNSNSRTNKGLGTINPSSGALGRVFVHVAGNTIVPMMTTLGLPKLGTTPRLDLKAMLPGAQGGIVLLGSGRLPVPLPTPFGNLLVKPPFFMSVFIPNGTGQLPLPVPNDPKLKGVVLDFQSMVFNLTTSVFGTTNGTEWFVGL